MNKLVIVISGQIVRENSANLMNFWRGFLHIQNSIHGISDLKIIGHSWNPEFDELVKNVYNPIILESEKQLSYIKEYMPLLNPVDKFEKGLIRATSTWHRVNPNMLIGQLTSKTKSILLLNELNLDENFMILSTRWDISCSGGKEVNNLVFDSSLPSRYLYLAYYSEIDEGYADMWFLGPYKYIKIFEKYKNFFLDAISNNNNYFMSFTSTGWPLAIRKNNRLFILNQYKKALLNKVFNKTNLNILKKITPFLANKIIGFQHRIKNTIEMPNITGENSLESSLKTDVVFPNYQALNIHAILKSFIINSNLREQTRFLDIKDFENLPKGQMINPLDFCYVIYSHSSFADCWKLAILQAIENLPINCKNIYLVSEESNETKDKFSKQFANIKDIELITYDGSEKYTNRLIQVFTEVSKKFDILYFVHEDMPLINKVDKVYLNGLIHYMKNSNEYYIKLVDTDYVDLKEEHDSFPGLVKNMGGYSISVQPALLKADSLVSFLTNFNEDIYGFEQMCIRTNFSFSAVKGDRKIGKYLLVNNFFPHIATAISKGKWCTSEWKDEINALADKYNINISDRGEC